MKKSSVSLLSACIMTGMIVSGCGRADTADESGNPGKVSTEPVTITAAIDGIIVEEDYERLITEQLKKKRPNITFQLIRPGKGTNLDDLIAAGQVPDLVFTYNGHLTAYQDKDLLYDLNPLIKSEGVDLGRFENGLLDDIRIASTNGELFGLPFGMNYHALYYNKDLFDKFGVAYPRDGMNWDQTLELARKLTRTDGGIQYRGLDPGNGIIWISQPLSLTAVDFKTEKATMNNEGWKKVFELVKSIYSIPGNQPGGSARDLFMKDKRLAMLPDLNILTNLDAAAKEGLNWDVAQYPSYPEKPNTYGNASVNVIMVTKTSPHKEQAFQVIEAATSDELQMEASKLGKVTSLKSPAVKEAFGQSMDGLKDKHMTSIFKSRPVRYPLSSRYRSKAEGIATQKFNAYLKGDLDVNTALSQADEEINQMIEADKVK